MLEFNGKERKTLTLLLYRIGLLRGQDQRHRSMNLAKGSAVKPIVGAGGTFNAALTQVEKRLRECLDMHVS